MIMLLTGFLSFKFSTSMSEIKMIPHRHAQRLVSQVSLDLRKLIVEIKQHTGQGLDEKLSQSHTVS